MPPKMTRKALPRAGTVGGGGGKIPAPTLRRSPRNTKSKGAHTSQETLISETSSELGEMASKTPERVVADAEESMTAKVEEKEKNHVPRSGMAVSTNRPPSSVLRTTTQSRLVGTSSPATTASLLFHGSITTASPQAIKPAKGLDLELPLLFSETSLPDPLGESAGSDSRHVDIQPASSAHGLHSQTTVRIGDSSNNLGFETEIPSIEDFEKYFDLDSLPDDDFTFPASLERKLFPPIQNTDQRQSDESRAIRLRESIDRTNLGENKGVYSLPVSQTTMVLQRTNAESEPQTLPNSSKKRVKPAETSAAGKIENSNQSQARKQVTSMIRFAPSNGVDSGEASEWLPPPAKGIKSNPSSKLKIPSKPKRKSQIQSRGHSMKRKAHDTSEMGVGPRKKGAKRQKQRAKEPFHFESDGDNSLDLEKTTTRTGKMSSNIKKTGGSNLRKGIENSHRPRSNTIMSDRLLSEDLFNIINIKPPTFESEDDRVDSNACAMLKEDSDFASISELQGHYSSHTTRGNIRKDRLAEMLDDMTEFGENAIDDHPGTRAVGVVMKNDKTIIDPGDEKSNKSNTKKIKQPNRALKVWPPKGANHCVVESSSPDKFKMQHDGSSTEHHTGYAIALNHANRSIATGELEGNSSSAINPNFQHRERHIPTSDPMEALSASTGGSVRGSIVKDEAKDVILISSGSDSEYSSISDSINTNSGIGNKVCELSIAPSSQRPQPKQRQTDCWGSNMMGASHKMKRQGNSNSRSTVALSERRAPLSRIVVEHRQTSSSQSLEGCEEISYLAGKDISERDNRPRAVLCRRTCITNNTPACETSIALPQSPQPPRHYEAKSTAVRKGDVCNHQSFYSNASCKRESRGIRTSRRSSIVNEMGSPILGLNEYQSSSLKRFKDELREDSDASGPKSPKIIVQFDRNSQKPTHHNRGAPRIEVSGVPSRPKLRSDFVDHAPKNKAADLNYDRPLEGVCDISGTTLNEDHKSRENLERRGRSTKFQNLNGQLPFSGLLGGQRRTDATQRVDKVRLNLPGNENIKTPMPTKSLVRQLLEELSNEDILARDHHDSVDALWDAADRGTKKPQYSETVTKPISPHRQRQGFGKLGSVLHGIVDVCTMMTADHPPKKLLRETEISNLRDRLFLIT
jgi:hypothetical protein